MKLTARQSERTADQLAARVIPDDHPLISQLTQLYGDHTFFIDSDGLDIVEPAEPEMKNATATVVKLASWADAKRTELAAHAPEVTTLVVDLESDDEE
jgi:hypothetical protein